MKYKIRIDRENLTVEQQTLTGAELLALVNKTSQSHRLHQKLKGGQVVRILPGEVVDLSQPGIERFMTLPLDQTEGDVPVRRDVALTSEDREHLDAHGHTWETVLEGRKRWVLIHDWATHDGYVQRHATLAILLPPGYPDAALDMVWFHPPLERKDGRTIGRTNVTETIAGRPYQRWSRHRSRENPWRPGVDSLATHILLIKWWLEREFQ